MPPQKLRTFIYSNGTHTSAHPYAAAVDEGLLLGEPRALAELYEKAATLAIELRRVCPDETRAGVAMDAAAVELARLFPASVCMFRTAHAEAAAL